MEPRDHQEMGGSGPAKEELLPGVQEGWVPQKEAEGHPPGFLGQGSFQAGPQEKAEAVQEGEQVPGRRPVQEDQVGPPGHQAGQAVPPLGGAEDSFGPDQVSPSGEEGGPAPEKGHPSLPGPDQEGETAQFPLPGRSGDPPLEDAHPGDRAGGLPPGRVGGGEGLSFQGERARQEDARQEPCRQDPGFSPLRAEPGQHSPSGGERDQDGGREKPCGQEPHPRDQGQEDQGPGEDGLDSSWSFHEGFVPPGQAGVTGPVGAGPGKGLASSIPCLIEKARGGRMVPP